MTRQSGARSWRRTRTGSLWPLKLARRSGAVELSLSAYHGMVTEPIIYVDQSEIRIGKLPELKAAIRELAALVEERQPQLAAYRAHLSADGRRMTVIHIHPDADSLDDYTRVAGPAFARFEDLVTLRRIDVYGSPSAEAVERLQDKARRLGDGTSVVQMHEFEAGFASAGSRIADRR